MFYVYYWYIKKKVQIYLKVGGWFLTTYEQYFSYIELRFSFITNDKRRYLI